MRTIRLNNKLAFTLVELLVTIMILLILAGLILPAIKGARERSRDILCKNHLKELQTAAMSYAINGDGSLPQAKSTERYEYNPSDDNWKKYRSGWIDWVNYESHGGWNKDSDEEPGETPWWGPDGLTCITNGALWPYIKNLKTYACPEWQREGVGPKNDPTGGLLTFDSTNNKPWRCYSMNYSVSGANIGNIEASKRLLFTEAGTTNFYDGVQIAERDLSKKLNYTFDKNSSTEAYGWDGCFSCQDFGEDYPRENVGLHHNGKANAIFVDGHIEKLAWNVTTNACSGNW